MEKGNKHLLMIMVMVWVPSVVFAQGNSPSIGNPKVGPSPQRIEDEYMPDPAGYRVESWVENLVIPWELVFLGDGRALVTERPGRIRLIDNGNLVEIPYLNLEDTVEHVGEGGLMGMAVHPDFPAAPYLYIMYTYRDGLTLYNGVARVRDDGNRGELEGFIVEGIPGGRIHDGGRIQFGPDGYLYITTGETGDPKAAQKRESLAGKILRINPDGSIPGDNPFPGSPVYSWGHRNPQGIDWEPETGTLFASEHGPSGEYGVFGHDEVNVIRHGNNYGWPLIIGEGGMDRYVDPVVMWPHATPPSGIAFHDGYLYVATLRSRALIRIDVVQEGGEDWKATEIVRLFADGRYSGTYGRLRNVVVGPDNTLYVLTSNRDGRGRPQEGDDKILRIVPE